AEGPRPGPTGWLNGTVCAPTGRGPVSSVATSPRMSARTVGASPASMVMATADSSGKPSPPTGMPSANCDWVTTNSAAQAVGSSQPAYQSSSASTVKLTDADASTSTAVAVMS